MAAAAAAPLLFLFLFLCYSPWPISSQTPASTMGFNCTADRSIYPCTAYALFRAGAAASPTDLAGVGDLFGDSRLSVARSSNLTANATLSPGEPLLVSLPCACPSSFNLSRSYAAVQYQINAGDTYYLVSTNKFQNLTEYHLVIAVNPTLVPEDLTIGVMVTFPIFCQCSSTPNSSLVTYVVQPSDTYRSIAADFGTDIPSLTRINGPEGSVSPYSVILVPMKTDTPPPVFLNRKTANATAASPPQPPPGVVQSNDQSGVVTGLAVALGIVGALSLLLILLSARLVKKLKQRRDAAGQRLEGREGLKMSDPSNEQLMGMNITEWLDKYRVFTVEDMRRATDDFDEARRIQGAVYKGSIDGEDVAVKKMRWDACEELKILQKVNHSNLVKLEGFCIDEPSGTCYLVYEYVENGSLDVWLRDPSAARRLDWRARLRIALDLAQALQYIHEHTWPRVVHKDVKSSNVLLDSRFRAKLANFGLARTGTNAVTTHIVGTQGYVAPEYLADGLVTTKVDVFAYGVVLLELVSGKEAVSDGGVVLWAEAEDAVFAGDDDESVHKEKVRAWMDAALIEQACPLDSVVTVVNIARACLQHDPTKRPSMVDVAFTLSKADEAFSDFSGDSLAAGDVAAR